MACGVRAGECGYTHQVERSRRFAGSLSVALLAGLFVLAGAADARGGPLPSLEVGPARTLVTGFSARAPAEPLQVATNGTVTVAAIELAAEVEQEAALRVVRLDANGHALDPDGVTLLDRPKQGYLASIASDGDGFLLVSISDGRLRAFTLDASGAPHGPAGGLDLGSAPRFKYASLAAVGGPGDGYVLSLADVGGASPGSFRRLDATGAALGEELLPASLAAIACRLRTCFGLAPRFAPARSGFDVYRWTPSGGFVSTPWPLDAGYGVGGASLVVDGARLYVAAATALAATSSDVDGLLIAAVDPVTGPLWSTTFGAVTPGVRLPRVVPRGGGGAAVLWDENPVGRRASAVVDATGAIVQAPTTVGTGSWYGAARGAAAPYAFVRDGTPARLTLTDDALAPVQAPTPFPVSRARAWGASAASGPDASLVTYKAEIDGAITYRATWLDGDGAPEGTVVLGAPIDPFAGTRVVWNGAEFVLLLPAPGPSAVSFAFAAPHAPALIAVKTITPLDGVGAFVAVGSATRFTAWNGTSRMVGTFASDHSLSSTVPGGAAQLCAGRCVAYGAGVACTTYGDGAPWATSLDFYDAACVATGAHLRATAPDAWVTEPASDGTRVLLGVGVVPELHVGIPQTAENGPVSLAWADPTGAITAGPDLPGTPSAIAPALAWAGARYLVAAPAGVVRAYDAAGAPLAEGAIRDFDLATLAASANGHAVAVLQHHDATLSVPSLVVQRIGPRPAAGADAGVDADADAAGDATTDGAFDTGADAAAGADSGASTGAGTDPGHGCAHARDAASSSPASRLSACAAMAVVLLARARRRRR